MASECIQVFCRARPMNESERRNDSTNVVKFKSDDTVIVGGKHYVYDHVFQPNCTQEAVYNTAARHIVQDVLSGYNGTIFAYGQTSSGKTHTMEGVIGDPEKRGIIPRIINDIFSHIFNLSDENMVFLIKVAYFEIYNERIRDLLDATKTNLAIHEDRNRIPFVKDVSEEFVTCPEEVLSYIAKGKMNRQLAATNMNEHSSRSHCVFQIQVEQSNKTTQRKLLGKLYLVDLAGSERVSKTGAEGAVLKEAKNINKSLSALGNVIFALTEETKSHVRYRDSKLTRILQESLGGNSRTTIVICCSPASCNEGETKSTLLFGQRAKTIKNVVVVNEEMLTAEGWKRKYEREREKVARLRQQTQQLVQELRKWRAGDKVSESHWTNLCDSSMSHSDITMTQSMIADSMETIFASADDQQTSAATDQQPLLSFEEERQKYEEEREKLYAQLDDKDDEIQEQSQLAERLKQQLVAQEEMTKQSTRDKDNAMADLQKACWKLCSDLEEVAQERDLKRDECVQLRTDIERLSDDIAKKCLEATLLNERLGELRELCRTQKKRVYEGIQSMVKEMADLGESNLAFSEKLQNDLVDEDKPIDEKALTHARICVSKLTGNYRAHRQKLSQLENGSDETAKKLEEVTTELAECRVQMQQMDAKTKSLQQAIGAQEKQKRQLENELDGLNAKLANATSAEMADHSEKQQKLIAQLRDQITQKNSQIEQLTESLQELQLSREQLQQDFERLKNDECEKESRLKALSALSDRREQAKQEMRGLEGTVNEELQTLHNLRKAFVQHLAHRMKETPTDGPEEDDEFLPSGTKQKRKSSILENNLEQLTSAHRQLVRDNAELRCELPKLEKRCCAYAERIQTLETVLGETKENAMKDRKKYQDEVEHIKEVVRQRNLARRGAQIAKPIRPGHHYGTSLNASGQP